MMSKPSHQIDQLVEECQGLVRFLARQIHARTSARVELDDLIGYGQVGLMQAANDFDSGKGTKFSTFAYYRIRGAIYDGINKLLWFRPRRDAEAKSGQLVDAYLREATAEVSTIRADDGNPLVAEAGWFSRVAASLAVVYLASPDTEQRTTDVADESAPDPSAEIVQQETRAKLTAAIERLPADVAGLIRAVYFDDRTLQEAADQLGISKSWASRMHSRALEQMARYLKDMSPENSS